MPQASAMAESYASPSGDSSVRLVHLGLGNLEKPGALVEKHRCPQGWESWGHYGESCGRVGGSCGGSNFSHSELIPKAGPAICHQLGRNELDLSGSEAPRGGQGLSRHLGPNYRAGPGTGSSCARARRAASPRCPLCSCSPAKLLMSGNGDFAP